MIVPPEAYIGHKGIPGKILKINKNNMKNKAKKVNISSNVYNFRYCYTMQFFCALCLNKIARKVTTKNT